MSGPVLLLKAKDYSGTGTWADQSGEGNDATLVTGRIAKNSLGNGIFLNGSTYWTFSNPALGNAWTVNVWYKRIGGIGPTAFISPTSQSGGINCIVYDNGNAGFLDGAWNQQVAQTFPLNLWMNLQVTWDGTTLISYVNSQEVATSTPGGTAPDGGNPYYIGRGFYVPDAVTGEIGEVRMYTRALTQGQVTADYNESYQTFHPLKVFLRAVDYSGSGTWADESDYGNDATKETGTIAKNAAGNGIVLDGSTGWTFPNVAVGNAWTANLWYKKTGADTGVAPAILTQIYTGTNDINISIDDTINNGTHTGGFYTSSTSAWNRGTSFTITNGVWINVQITWNGTNLKTYINGALVGTTTPGVTCVDGATDYRIGRGSNNSYYVIGEIGEVRIYNIPLTQAQVTADYYSSYEIFYPWLPTSITGLQLWMDSQDLATLSLSGADVTAWADKSGLGNSTTAVTGTPGFVAGKGITFNGSSYFSLPNGTLPYGNSSYTIYYVATYANNTTFSVVLYGGDAAAGADNKFFAGHDGGQPTLVTGWGNSVTLRINDGGVGVPIVYDTSYESGYIVTAYTNGGSVGTTTPATSRIQPNTGNYIGTYAAGVVYMEGTISEILVYNTPHNPVQRQVVEGYLAWKWGTQARLPATHPFYTSPPTYNQSTVSLVLLLKAINYSGSGTWNDQSGQANNATLEGGTIAKNVIGNGIVLNGSTSWTFPNVAAGKAWTASVWFKKTAAGSGTTPCILTQILATDKINLTIGDINDDGTLLSGFYNNGWYNGSAITLPLNQWANIQVTWNGTDLATYLNGTALGTTQPGGTAADAGTAYRIGRGWTASGYVTGEIGEVRIYRYALSLIEVQEDFASSYDTFMWNPTVFAGLQLWLDATDPLNTGTPPATGTTITTWYDKSGLSNNATADGTIPYSVAALGGLPGMVLAGAEGFHGPVAITGTGVSAFIVMTMNSSSDNYAGCISLSRPATYDVGTVGSVAFTRGQNFSYMTLATNYTGGVVTPSVGAYNWPLLNEFWYDGTNGYVTSIENSSVTTVNNYAWASPFDVSVYSLGQRIGSAYSGPYLNGVISEVIIYNTALTTSQRRIVEGYLAWKWNLEGKLAPSHPYYSAPPPAAAGMTNVRPYVRPAVYSNSVTMWWQPPLRTGGYDISGYTITSLDTPFTPLSVPAASLQTYVVGLNAGFPYTFQIAATNTNGDTSQAVSFRTVRPGAKTSAPLRATASMAGNGTTTLNWDPPYVGGNLGYAVVLVPASGTTIKRSAGPSQTSIVVAADPTKTYACSVASVNDSGWSVPATVSVNTTPFVPDAVITQEGTTFTVTTRAGITATSWAWTVNSVAQGSTTSTMTYVPTVVGTYTVQATVNTTYVATYVAFKPGVAIQTSGSTVITETPLPFTAEALLATYGPYAYAWSISDGSTTNTLGTAQVQTLVTSNVSGLISPYTLNIKLGSVPSYTSDFFVCCGTNISYSYDGINWTQSPSANTLIPTGTSLCVAYNGFRWVAGCQYITAGDTILVYSDDGITWTASANGNDIFTAGTYGRACTSVIWNGSLWIAGGTNKIAYSTDGITWTSSSSGSGLYSNSADGFASNGVITVVVGGDASSFAAYSYDGNTWTPAASSNILGAAGGCTGIACNGIMFVAGGTLGYSYDGINWTTSANGSSVFTGLYGVSEVTWTGTKWVAVGRITDILGYSYDGIHWAVATTDPFDSYTWAVASGKSIVVAGEQSATVSLAYSRDGISWTANPDALSVVGSVLGIASKNALIETYTNTFSGLTS